VQLVGGGHLVAPGYRVGYLGDGGVLVAVAETASQKVTA
jgi:hypothetical protein